MPPPPVVGSSPYGVAPRVAPRVYAEWRSPAHLLGAAAIAVAVGNRGAHHLWSVIPAVPRCTPVLAAHQLQTSILASTSRSVPRCTPVLAAPSSRPVSWPVRVARSPGVLRSWQPPSPDHYPGYVVGPQCTPVAGSASTGRSVPWRPTSSGPVSQPVPFARSPGLLPSWRLTSSRPVSQPVRVRLVRRCTPAPAATHPKTAIPADTPHKCIEVQLVPIGLIVVSTARNRGPRCRHHNCFADDREARRQDRFYPSGDEFEDGVAHRQNPSRRHLSKEACLPRRFPSPWSVEEPDPKLDRRCFIVRHANGHALAYVYFEEERGRRAAAGPPIAALGIRKRLWAHAAGWDRRRVWLPSGTILCTDD